MIESKSIIIIITLFLFSRSCLGNEDSTKIYFKNFSLGVELINSSLSGNKGESTEMLGINKNRKYNVLDHHSNFSHGILISFEKYKKGKRLSFIPEFGVYFYGGYLSTRYLVQEIVNPPEVISEFKSDFDFNSYFFHSTYGLKYKLIRKLGIDVVLSTKISYMFIVTSNGLRIRSLIDYNQDPIEKIELHRIDGDFHFDFVRVQVNIKYGLRKSFVLSENSYIEIAFEQESPLIKLNHNFDIKSRPITLSIRYGFIRVGNKS